MISIDFWGTLGKSSPDFYPKKIELLQAFISTSDMDIENGLNTTKEYLNDLIEKTGFQPSIDVIFKYLLSNINKRLYKITECDLTQLIKSYQELATEYSPIVFSEDTINCIHELKDNGHMLTLSCNTMLITSVPILQSLHDWGIYNDFRYTLFSDEMGYAKPNALMYNRSNYHIGDNAITDGLGARLARSQPILINSTKLTIRDAIDIISNHQLQF